MRTLAIGIATAATVLAAVPALAQVGVRVGEPGVSVRIGPDHPGYRAHAEERVVIGEGRRHDCTRTTVRERVNGRVIVRTRERC